MRASAMKTRCSFFLRVLFFLWFTALCSAVFNVQGADGAKSTANSLQTPSDEDCVKFSKNLENVARRGDLAAFNALIDVDALLARVTSGIEVPEKVRLDFIKGEKTAFISDSGYASQIINRCASGGSFKFLRITSLDDQKTALFRLIMAAGEVNYFGFILTPKSDGTILATDVYLYTAAERVSDYMRRGYLPVAAEGSKSILKKLTQPENEYLQHAKDVLKMMESLKKGDFQETLRIHSSLPETLKKEKTIMFYRLSASQKIGHDEYMAAVDAFRAQFPNDPALNIMLIDYYFVKKEYPAAHKAIDALDNSLGGDAYLNVLRANLHLSQKDYDKARDCLNKAVSEENTLKDAYLLLLLISLQEKKFHETSRWLSALVEKCGAEIGDLTKYSHYTEYVQSPEYEKWLESSARDKSGVKGQTNIDATKQQ
jgi:tetratricopeptide (TPR) repeat protein